MSDNISVPWAGLFCGRKRELEALEAAWARVSAQASGGGGPELVVLLGESGLGKTRLVQEFFARLSTSLDGAGEGGYWPDRLTRAANNLRINPDPAECNPSGAASLPYLWWGMRMLDQGGRNSGMAGLHEAIGFLRPHLEPFARARLLSGKMKGAAKAAAIDAAVEIGNVFTFGLLGFGKLGVDHLSEWKEIGAERAALKTFEIGAANEQQRQSLVDLALGDLAALFDGKAEKGAKLPAVFLLDDAQWLADDETTRIFVGELFDRAKAQGWPLLVIATHWEREWHEDLAAGGERFATLASRFGGEGWEPVALRKEPDLGAMVAAAFPGLDPAQNALLLEKADGNPRLLDEILRYLQRKKGHFEGRDPGGRLSERGEADIREHQFALHELVADRLAEAPDNVRTAVGLAGLQGIRFLARLTALAAEAIGESDVAGGLAVAERPHALIAKLEEGISEFAQRVYREVALEQLADLIDEEEAADALRASLLLLAGAQGRFERLSPDERGVAWMIGIALLSDEGFDPSDEERELLGWCYAEASWAAYEQKDRIRALELAREAFRAHEESRTDLTVLANFALDGFDKALHQSGDVAARLFFAGELLKRARERGHEGKRDLLFMRDSLTRMADAVEEAEGPAAALEYRRESLDLSRIWVGENDSEDDLRSFFWDLGLCAMGIASAQGEVAARPYFEEALQVAQDLAERDPSDANKRALAGAIGNTMLNIQSVEGNEAARPYAERQVALWRELLDAAEPGSSYRMTVQFSLASALCGMAIVHNGLEEFGEGFAALEEAIELRKPLFETALEPNLLAAQSSDLMLAGLTRAKLDGDDRDRAIAMLRESHALGVELHRLAGSVASRVRIAGAARHLGGVLARDGQYEEAATFLAEARRRWSEVFERVRTADACDSLVHAIVGMARLLAQQERYGEALAQLEEARTILREGMPEGNEKFAAALAGIDELVAEYS